MRTVSKAVAKQAVVTKRISQVDSAVARIVTAIEHYGNTALIKLEAIAAGKFQKRLKQVIDYQTRRSSAALEAMRIVQREHADAQKEVAEALKLQE